MARIKDSAVIPDNKEIQVPQIQADRHHAHNVLIKAVEETRNVQIERPNTRQFCRKLCRSLFYLHLLLITILAVALAVLGFLVSRAHHPFHPRKWYPPLLTAVGCAGITAWGFQAITRCSPSRFIRLAFWFSPLLTCGAGVLLVATGSAGGLVVGVVAIVFGIDLALYACWVNPRFDHAIAILTVSTAFPPPKTSALTTLTVTAVTLYSSLMVVGISGTKASGTGLDTVFIVIILLSLAWTQQVIKNMLQVTISRVKFFHFSSGTEEDTYIALSDAMGFSAGPICTASVLIPLIGLIRGSSRAVSLVAGDTDEFLFSCTDCYSSITSRLVMFGNRWGLVHIGIYGKGIIRASSDTWDMFKKAGMEQLIDCDLTSSFCFLCGMAGGALSSLAGGTWALVVHKDYATEITIYAFLIGYFTCRVAMAWPQACVLAYHVAFAENPQSARFDATIPIRLQELQRNQD